MFIQLTSTALAQTGDVTYLSFPQLNSLKNSLITLAGTALIILLVTRIVVAYAKKEWSLLVTEVIAVLFVGWFVWDTDGAISVLKDISSSIFGGGGSGTGGGTP